MVDEAKGKGQKDQDLLAVLHEECWDLRCRDVPGIDDSDVWWEVIEHHMSEPRERLVGEGATPQQAIRDALSSGPEAGPEEVAAADAPAVAPSSGDPSKDPQLMIRTLNWVIGTTHRNENNGTLEKARDCIKAQLQEAENQATQLKDALATLDRIERATRRWAGGMMVHPSPEASLGEINRMAAAATDNSSEQATQPQSGG